MDNKQRIISYLGKHIRKRFTMNELSKIVGIPYASFYRTVQQMTNLLHIEAVGKAKTIALNVSNTLLKAHLAIASDEERNDFLQTQPVLRKIVNELNTTDVVVLFGSYAKGKPTEKSDIDLFVINNRGDRSLSFSKYELLFKKDINPLFVTQKEFKKMLHKKEENVGKQVVENHIVLNNPEKFWELVLDGI